jgi:hypothetical protein
MGNKTPFLPDDYKPPVQDGKYMKFQEGENRIRVMSAPVLGYELWVNGKPKRVAMDKTFTQADLDNADINKFTGKRKTPQHFWAMIVWNYNTGKLQILQVTQATIQRAITAYTLDPDWGAPFEYDILIKKEGEGRDVEYSVISKPHKLIDPAIATEYKDASINLQALFDGGDPFDTSVKKVEEVIDEIFGK